MSYSVGTRREREARNRENLYMVAVMKYGLTVGHVPRTISGIFAFLFS